jgi:hypothetical protein
VWAKTPPGRDLELIYRNAGKVLAVSIATSPEFRISEPRVLFDRRELRAELIESLPDGRLLIAQQEERQDEVAQFNVVLDWFEDLKRLARAPHCSEPTDDLEAHPRKLAPTAVDRRGRHSRLRDRTYPPAADR